jgi:maleylacetoacetate isomerase
METILHGYWRSSASWRVRLALNLKGIEYATQPVHLVKDGGEQWSDAYRSMNPAGEVPTLQIDGLVLAQSLAIIEYLEETRPEPALMPASPADRAMVRRLAEQVNASIQPLQNLRVLIRLKSEIGASEEAKNAWAHHYIQFGLAAYERILLESAGKYSVGDAVSMADCCLIPQIYNADRFAVDLEPMPTIRRVMANLYELPAVQAAHPDKQPDAPAHP